MTRAVMGFDPGVQGGLAVLDARGAVVVALPFRRGMSEDAAIAVVKEGTRALLQAGGWECYAEKVGYIKGDGGKGSFTFGGVYRAVRFGLKMGGVHLYDVPPALWQAKLECLTGGDKAVSKRRAIELFPGVKVTNAVADALLIALYGRLMTGSARPYERPPLP